MAFKRNLAVLLFACFLILAAEVQFNQAVERRFEDSPRYKECVESCIQDINARMKERGQSLDDHYVQDKCQDDCKPPSDEDPGYPGNLEDNPLRS
ncbi:hypothetical protein MKW98_030182 [Papaver atlanticum]|uniref:Uncharacterized protein n=1 Tax=Papaver atlanticum TaxID=357466 RepID=A0AAD4SRA0_9MAGN|nr:hypothetical protein MKW98_030182 [Papaver atlanticum]